MFELVLQMGFSAAHSLRGYEGVCERLHGHNWKVDVYLRRADLDDTGMVLDFKVAKQHLGAVLDEIDHRHLNELAYFREHNPTTESIARFITRELSARLPDSVRVDRVTAWESERCGATYWPAAADEA